MGLRKTAAGPSGYTDLLEILADESHERFEEMQDWAGPGFDPEEFSQDAMNSLLRRNRSLALKSES
jgi:hypothetical protein